MKSPDTGHLSTGSDNSYITLISFHHRIYDQRICIDLGCTFYNVCTVRAITQYRISSAYQLLLYEQELNVYRAITDWLITVITINTIMIIRLRHEKYTSDNNTVNL